jgi:signal transduction histidine kinase
VADIVRPTDRTTHMIELLVGSILLGVVYVFAARRFSTEAVLTVGLALDTLLIAAMTAAVGVPALLAAPYFWSIALGAFFLGPIETGVYTVLAAVCAAVVPFLSDLSVDGLVVVTDVLVIALIGGLLTLLAGTARTTERQLMRDRAYDATALEIATALRMDDLDAGLQEAVRRIGLVTGGARARLQVARRADGSSPLYQWTRAGVAPIPYQEPPEEAQALLRAGRPLYVRDASRVGAALAASVRDLGMESGLGYPLVWQERVLGLLSVLDDRPRDWEREGEPLLQRIVPLVVTALADADVLERQRLTVERLEELNRLSEELIANVSHELRTPLTSTIGFLQTLERSDIELGIERRAEFLSLARIEAQRLARLVSDLLDLTRYDRGVMRLDLGDVRVREIAERAAGRLQVPLGRAVRLDLPDVHVRADENRLLQVLSNLIENGLRHGAGDVCVDGAVVGDTITICVSDGGSGVPPANVEEIFTPFVHFGATTGSSGLGLAIARRIALAHGGSLAYRAATNGETHAFVLDLPTAAAPAFGADGARQPASAKVEGGVG